MKTISYKGQLAMGTQDRIRLKTIKGKIGYKISKFQLMPGAPGVDDVELVGKIFKKDQTGSISPVVNFTDSELLAAVYYQDDSDNHHSDSVIVVFDNEPFNQDIFVTIDDAGGASHPANYYIELETMTLSDIEATELTLQNLRTIVS